jgi:hypothetical protein
MGYVEKRKFLTLPVLETGEAKILDPTGTRNSDPSVVQPLDSHYTDTVLLVG